MKLRYLLLYLTLGLLFTACSDDDDNSSSSSNITTVTLNVDVVLPQAIQKDWSNSIQMALDNIAKAQQRQKKRVTFNLRYHDEDKEDLDALAYQLTHPSAGSDTCHAIIGPYHSQNARALLNYAAASRLPVLMPTCSSAELQRIETRRTNTWFFTESDITQCELLLSLGKSRELKRAALIYSDDSYGKSFYNWFSYMATEYRMALGDDCMFPYKPGEDLSKFMAGLRATGEDTYLCLALSSPAAYLDVLKQVGETYDVTTEQNLILAATDVAASSAVFNSDYNLMGINPVASPSSGFSESYRAIYGRQPYNGEAQVYDALCVLALGAAKRMWAANPNELTIDGKQVAYDEKPYGPTLTDWMRAVVADEEGPSTQWTDYGLSLAFNCYSRGQSCCVNGAIGPLLFDQTSRTAILQTRYAIWKKYGKEIFTLGYLTTAESNDAAELKSVWEWDKLYEQQFDPTLKVDHDLPDATDRWAVVVATSTTWSNYRHQADAFAMYQLLRHHGYDDDHIVLICEDNLAYDSHNTHQGEIFVLPSADNVRKNAKVDYKFSDLSRDDLCNILLGNASDRLPSVIHSTATSNVLFFWSGHGAEGAGPLWGDESATFAFGTDRLKQTISEMHQEKKYRRMMLAIETCFSGLWGEAITGIPDVVAITAANAHEPSKADVHDRDLGVFLSNAFARSFRDAINEKPNILIHDLYTSLARTTTGSHVSLYNEVNYGSVYETDMSDYVE